MDDGAYIILLLNRIIICLLPRLPLALPVRLHQRPPPLPHPLLQPLLRSLLLIPTNNTNSNKSSDNSDNNASYHIIRRIRRFQPCLVPIGGRDRCRVTILQPLYIFLLSLVLLGLFDILIRHSGRRFIES